MALDFVKPIFPDDVKLALLYGVSSFRSVDSASRQTLVAAAQGFLGERIGVFTLGVPDVLPDGAGLRGAAPSGWRVAAGSGKTAMAADVYTVARGGPHPLPADTPRLACVRKGAEVERMLRAIAALSAPPLVDHLPNQPLILHLLSLPGLFTEALWLQPQGGTATGSIVIPFYTLIENFPLLTPYSEQEFVSYVQPVAQYWQQYRSSQLLSRPRQANP